MILVHCVQLAVGGWIEASVGGSNSILQAISAAVLMHWLGS